MSDRSLTLPSSIRGVSMSKILKRVKKEIKRNVTSILGERKVSHGETAGL